MRFIIKKLVHFFFFTEAPIKLIVWYKAVKINHSLGCQLNYISDIQWVLFHGVISCRICTLQIYIGKYLVQRNLYVSRSKEKYFVLGCERVALEIWKGALEVWINHFPSLFCGYSHTVAWNVVLFWIRKFWREGQEETMMAADCLSTCCLLLYLAFYLCINLEVRGFLWTSYNHFHLMKFTR